MFNIKITTVSFILINIIFIYVPGNPKELKLLLKKLAAVAVLPIPVIPLYPVMRLSMKRNQNQNVANEIQVPLHPAPIPRKVPLRNHKNKKEKLLSYRNS